ASAPSSAAGSLQMPGSITRTRPSRSSRMHACVNRVSWIVIARVRLSSCRAGGGESVGDEAPHALDRHPLLGHRVAVTNRDGAVLEGFHVDGDAPRRSDLVLAAVQLADR